MARTALALSGSLLILALNIAASVRVARWDPVTSAQKAAWFALIWTIPLLGSLLALQITAEPLRGPPTGQASGVGIGDGIDLIGLDAASHSDGDFNAGHGGGH